MDSAAPAAPMRGMTSRFKTKSNTAPQITESITAFSLPSGTSIWLPVIPFKALKKTVGIKSCMESVAPTNASPEIKTIESRANNVKNKVSGRVTKSRKFKTRDSVCVNF